MMDKVTVDKINDVFLQIRCDYAISRELSEYFSYTVPGHQHMPKFRSGMWDGKFRIYKAQTGKLYCGLIKHLEVFCKDREYDFEVLFDTATEEFSTHEALEWISTAGVPEDKENRDYQVEAFCHSIRNKRALLLSPTASGKSLIIHYIQQYLNLPTLIIVPTIGLVHQMYSDFEEYGFDSATHIHKIFEGANPNTSKRVVVSTWQAIHKLPKKWFSRFKVLLGDEAHGFKAQSLTSISEKMTTCPYKIGFTGTLDDSECNKLILEGLFGPVKIVATTRELIDAGYLSPLNIKCVVLKYSDAMKKKYGKLAYPDEIKLLTESPVRNKFITNLALSLDGNVLVMFKHKAHGRELERIIRGKTNRPVFFIDGGVKGKARDDIRKIVDSHTNAILIASVGTSAVGINIVNLAHCIFCHPSKARIKVLQAIGRILRKSKLKLFAQLYDIADDLSWGGKVNHTIRHFLDRLKMYDSEEHIYTIFTVSIKDG